MKPWSSVVTWKWWGQLCTRLTAGQSRTSRRWAPPLTSEWDVRGAPGLWHASHGASPHDACGVRLLNNDECWSSQTSLIAKQFLPKRIDLPDRSCGQWHSPGFASRTSLSYFPQAIALPSMHCQLLEVAFSSLSPNFHLPVQLPSAVSVQFLPVFLLDPSKHFLPASLAPALPGIVCPRHHHSVSSS